MDTPVGVGPGLELQLWRGACGVAGGLGELLHKGTCAVVLACGPYQTLVEAVLEELQPMGRNYNGVVEGCEEEGVVEENCYGLTATPLSVPAWDGVKAAED